MMIGKFHKLIQSRVLWTAILVVIVFAFVVWGIQLPGERGRRTAETAPGILDGKPVPIEEFQAAFQHAYAGLVFTYGRRLPETRELHQALRMTAWERLAEIRLAGQLGIRVSDGEVNAAIHAQPLFHQNGRFDLGVYRGQVAQLMELIGSPGTSPRFFEEHIRQELIRHRLREAIADIYLVPPMDLRRMVSTITDRFDLDLVLIQPDPGDPDPGPDEAGVRAFFEANPERYRIPESVRIQLVRFTPDPDDPDLPDPDELDIEEYYETHLHRFWTREEPAEDEAPAQPRLESLEEVRPRILALLRKEASELRAIRQAERFSELVDPRLPGATPVPFGEAAARMGVEPVEIGPFPSSAGPAETGLSRPVLFAAFDLLPEERVSRPVSDGRDAVVFRVTERLAPRIPPFEEVRDRVGADARRHAARAALARQARDLYESARQADSLRRAAEAEGREVLRKEAFSATEAGDLAPEIPADALLQGILALDAGELSEPIQTGADTWIVAQVLDRSAAPPGQVESMRHEVAGMLAGERGRQVHRDLLDDLMRPDRFIDLRPLREEPLDPHVD